MTIPRDADIADADRRHRDEVREATGTRVVNLQQRVYALEETMRRMHDVLQRFGSEEGLRTIDDLAHGLTMTIDDEPGVTLT